MLKAMLRVKSNDCAKYTSMLSFYANSVCSSLYGLRIAKFVIKTKFCQSVMAFYLSKHSLFQTGF